MLVPRRVHQRITGLEKKNADWVLRRGGFFFPNYIFLMFHHVARQLVYHFGSSSSRSSWRKSTCWRSWLLGRHAWVFEWRKARGSSRMEQQSLQEELEEWKRWETSKHGQRCDPSAWRISQHERISEEGQVVSSHDQHRSRVSSRKACGKDAVWCLGSSWNIGSAGSSLQWWCWEITPTPLVRIRALGIPEGDEYPFWLLQGIQKSQRWGVLTLRFIFPDTMSPVDRNRCPHLGGLQTILIFWFLEKASISEELTVENDVKKIAWVWSKKLASPTSHNMVTTTDPIPGGVLGIIPWQSPIPGGKGGPPSTWPWTYERGIQNGGMANP